MLLPLGQGGQVVALAVTKALPENGNLAKQRTYIAPGTEVSVI